MSRRTKSSKTTLKAAFYEIIEEKRPMTVRQVFYQVISRGERFRVTELVRRFRHDE